MRRCAIPVAAALVVGLWGLVGCGSELGEASPSGGLTLVNPEVAETLADEVGAGIAVLDPLEGLTDESQGDDYLEVMRSNLENLQAGQPCP